MENVNLNTEMHCHFAYNILNGKLLLLSFHTPQPSYISFLISG